MSLEGAIAVHRFGLGARPGEVAKASENPRAWLLSQIAPAPQPSPLDGKPFSDAATLLKNINDYRRDIQSAKSANNADAIKTFQKSQRDILIGEMQARFNLGFTTDKPFAERLVWFWNNHFTISANNPAIASLAGAYEREAIRPHIAGKFEDMLFAVSTHPAMMIYLNNAQSIGPNSLAGQTAKRGLNENFGRELMELYSLGVDGGYTQADVIALAKLLTGWSIDNNQGGMGGFGGGGGITQAMLNRPAVRARLEQMAQNSPTTVSDASSGFRYFPNRHEPGDVKLRGKTYAASFQGGRDAIRDLARDPSTAKFISRKFAVHFISDNPPGASVSRLEKIFRDSGGDLGEMAKAVVNDDAAWTSGPGKMRSPVEYVTASYRLLNLPQEQQKPRQIQGAMQACRLMGQFPMNAPAPKGWPDDSASWSGPDAVLSRIEWAKQIGSRLPQTIGVSAVIAQAENALGPLLSAATKSTIAAAATGGDAVALLIASPEFQRR
jgi:uncharacterized protein (DUF1800 family)